MPLDDSSRTHISPRVHSCGNFDIPGIRCEMSDLDRISPQPLDAREIGYSILDSDACPPRPFFASISLSLFLRLSFLSSKHRPSLSSLSRTVDLTKEN